MKDDIKPSRDFIDAKAAFIDVNQKLADLNVRFHKQKTVVHNSKNQLTSAEKHCDKILARVALGEAPDDHLISARKTLQEIRVDLSEAEDLYAGMQDATKLLMARRDEISIQVNREHRNLCNAAYQARIKPATTALKEKLADFMAVIAIKEINTDLETVLLHAGLLIEAQQAGMERTKAALMKLNNAGEQHGTSAAA